MITENKRPSAIDLQRYVVHEYASKWNGIAIELGLKTSTVDNIKTNNQKCEDRLKDTLQKWLDVSVNATWNVLEVAVTNVKRAEMSLDPIINVYGENTSI